MERRRRRRRGTWVVVLMVVLVALLGGGIVTAMAASDVHPVDDALETVSAQADLPLDLSRPHEWVPHILGRPVVEEQPSAEGTIRRGSIVFEDDDFVVTIFVPLTSNPAVDQAIQQHLERRIDALAERLRIGDLDQIDPPSGPRPEVRDEINANFEVDYASETVAAFRLITRVYTRSAGAITAYDGVIFNLKNGDEILPADLFRPGSPYLQRLSELSRQQLPHLLPADLLDAAGQDRIQRGTEPLPENFDGITISPDWDSGILISFDEGQVTPPGRELPRLAIALDAVKDLLNPATIALTHPRYAHRLELQGHAPEATPTREPAPPTATPKPATPAASAQPKATEAAPRPAASTAAPPPAKPDATATTASASPAAPTTLTPAANSATATVPAPPATATQLDTPSPAGPQPSATAKPGAFVPPPTATPAAPAKPVATPAASTPAPAGTAPAAPSGTVDCATQRCIALTFDDGPQSPYTGQILDVLRAEGGKATFFMLGQKVVEDPELVRRVLAEGHEVGNHTWSHKQLTTLSEAEIRQEIQSTQDAFRNAAGITPRIFRPPYGATNATVQSIAGLTQVLWNVDTNDWQDRDPEIVTKRVLDSARPGAIVLMHDIHATTAQTVPPIVRALKAQGYALVTVSTLRGD